MPYIASRMMKPWFVMLSMALPVCEMQRQKAGFKALDVTIAQTAQKNGSRIVGLETVREQFAAFAGLSLADQKALLVGSLHRASMLNDQIETMKHLYLQRRTGALWHLSRLMSDKQARTSEQENTAVRNFETRLLTKRNKVMSQRAQPLLAKGNVFIAVGALHLPGEKGLVSLLQKAGYKLSLVY